MFITKLLHKYLTVLGTYIQLMGKVFSRPERLRMYSKQYIKEMTQLGVDYNAIVLLISFFIGAVICIQIKINIANTDGLLVHLAVQFHPEYCVYLS